MRTNAIIQSLLLSSCSTGSIKVSHKAPGKETECNKLTKTWQNRAEYGRTGLGSAGQCRRSGTGLTGQDRTRQCMVELGSVGQCAALRDRANRTAQLKTHGTSTLLNFSIFV